MASVPSELQNWDEITKLANSYITASQSFANIKALEKQVLAMVNLGENVFNAQKHMSKRLDDLNSNIQKSINASDVVSKRTFWLTITLVTATVLQVFAAIITVLLVLKGK